MTNRRMPRSYHRKGDAAGQAAQPETDISTALPLWIQPRATSDGVVGERQDMVAIRLQAPPVDGAANAALLRFLAGRLGCPTGAVRLLRGERGRRKWVAVEGLTAAELKRRLLGLSDS